ncbi:MAG: tryptophan halogenase family protein [Pirellulales bacterium]
MNLRNPQSAQTNNRGASPLRVVIVGGGTAGWMAAATLRRRLGCQVTLIESPNVPTIGVGEATIPSLLDWLENMGLDEQEFMQATGATYKLAIRFDNWIAPNHRYWHPFGICGIRIDGVDIAHFWQRGMSEGWLTKNSAYTEFSLQRELCEANTMAVDANNRPTIANYAFHLDAARLAKHLSTLAQGEGVTRICSDVTGVRLDEEGAIESLQLADHPDVAGDLFIDCTGFAGVLIERALQVKWIDHSHQLLCDRAVVVRAPHTCTEIAPYTISAAQEAGWAWRIPLEKNIGCGYVFSSNHIGSQRAEEQLLKHAGVDPATASTRELKMRIGCRQTSWHKNCIAIGLSSGFVEPLESTGIFMVQRALDDLVDCLPASCLPNDLCQNDAAINSLSYKACNQTLFNARTRAVFDEIRDFVLLHYIVSQRDDSQFWKDARKVNIPDSLARFLEQYQELGRVQLDNPQPVFAEANHHFIMTGAGYRPANRLHAAKSHRAWQYPAQQIRTLLNQTFWQNQRMAATSPSHRSVIATREMTKTTDTPSFV